MTATVLLALTCPALGLALCYYNLTEEFFDWKSAIVCMALFVSALAYSYRPTINADIVRYIRYVEALYDVPFENALDIMRFGEEGLWLFAYWSWFIAKLGDPF